MRSTRIAEHRLPFGVEERAEDLRQVGRMLLLQQVQQIGRRANAEQPLDRVEDDVNSALRSHGDPCNFTVTSADLAIAPSVGYFRFVDGRPSESSIRSSSRQPSRTLTWRSRNTRASKNCSSSLRAAVPIALMHEPALPDQDRLLRLPLDEDRAVEPHQALGVRLFELVDHDRGRKRQFVACLLQAPARERARRRRTAPG